MTGNDDRRRDRPRTQRATADERGQAYTLESLIAAVLLLSAVLFALQAIVITPDSSGDLPRDTQTQIQQQSNDVLLTAANDGELSRQLRYWNVSEGRFADDPDRPGNAFAEGTGYLENVPPVEDFGTTLAATTERMNLLVRYQDNGTTEETYLVKRGTPTGEAIVATVTVTLTEDMYLTGPDADGRTIGECAAATDCSTAIPNEHDEPVYNVVEVRVVVW